MKSQEIANYSAFLLQELNFQRESCCYCDVTITTSNGSEFFAHSSVLAATSTWFQSELEGKGRREHLIVLGDVQWDIVSMFLDVVYTGRLVGSEYISAHYISQLCSLSDSLQCKPVYDLCSRLLRDRRLVGLAHDQKEQESQISSIALNLESSTIPTVGHAVADPGLVIVNSPCPKSPTFALLDEMATNMKIPTKFQGKRDNTLDQVESCKETSGRHTEAGQTMKSPGELVSQNSSLSYSETASSKLTQPDTRNESNTSTPSEKTGKKRTRLRKDCGEVQPSITSHSKHSLNKSNLNNRSHLKNMPQPIRKSARKKKAIIRDGFQTSSLPAKRQKISKHMNSETEEKSFLSRNSFSGTQDKGLKMLQKDFQKITRKRSVKKEKQGTEEKHRFSKEPDFLHNNDIYVVSHSEADQSEVMQTFAQITLKLLEGMSAKDTCQDESHSGEKLIVEDGEPDPETVADMFDQVLMLLNHDADNGAKSTSENQHSNQRSNGNEKALQQWKQCKYCSRFKGRKKGRFDFHRQFCRSKYKCELCSKPFLNPMDLSKHSCKHINKFVCDICGRVLADRSNLKLHQQWHAGIRSKVCQHCGRRFLRACHLQAHIAHIHSEERPHQCPHCSATYAFKYELNRHMQKHSKSPNFICDSCGASFYECTRLWAHKKKEHKNTETPGDDTDVGDSEPPLSADLSLVTSTMYLPPGPSGGHNQKFADSSAVMVEPVETLQEVQIVSTMSDLTETIDNITDLTSLSDVGSGLENQEHQSLGPNNQIVYQTVAYISSDGHLVYQQGL